MNLTPLLRPRSVAVIGASPNASFVTQIFSSLLRYGYPGTLVAVNPKYQRVMDVPCYPSVLDVPNDLDLAIIGVAHRLVPSVLEQCERKGVGAVCVVTSGFGEIAAEAGADRQKGIAAWSTRTGIPLTGPNCLGLLNAHERFVALPPYWRETIAGEVGVILQSGMMAPTITMPLVARGIGLSCAVTTGNEAALEAADLIRYFASDPQTRVIASFAEQIKTPSAFIAACEAAAVAGKPIVMLKIGRSEGARRAARAHTGSLVGADDVTDLMLRRLGVTRVASVDELVETVALFHTRKLPKGRGVAVISVSGGVGGLLSDQAQEIGIEFPPLPEETARKLVEVVPEFGSVGNPLDVTGQGVFETRILDASLDYLSEAPGVDVVVHARGWPAKLDRSLALGQALERAVERHPEVLYLVLSMGGGKLYDGPYAHTAAVEPFDRIDGVPFLQSSEEGLRAIASLIRYAEFQRRRAEDRVAGAPPRRASVEAAERARALVRQANGRPLTERESKDVLTLYGIRTTRERLVTTVEDAREAAVEIGYPVVLKIESPDVLHKTEIGAVALNLEDAEAVRIGFARIEASARQHAPNADIRGVLVQEMAPRGGVEMILGMARDPQWGPVVACGIGGTLVEVLQDRQLLLPPVGTAEARAALDGLRGARLLEGVRGAEPCDVAALTDALVRFSELCADLGDLVDEIDVNPLIVLKSGQGVMAVDALVVPS
ncbi:MAG: acetate--CoA ligase family protein [Chloroflexi bacterium]|nr:acetate--CoA ligase family protein [Chloroflexota bacterium]